MSTYNIIKDLENMSIQFIENKDIDKMNENIENLIINHNFSNTSKAKNSINSYLNNNDNFLNLSIFREKVNKNLDIIDIKLYHKYRLIYTITLSIIL